MKDGLLEQTLLPTFVSPLDRKLGEQYSNPRPLRVPNELSSQLEVGQFVSLNDNRSHPSRKPAWIHANLRRATTLYL